MAAPTTPVILNPIASATGIRVGDRMLFQKDDYSGGTGGSVQVHARWKIYDDSGLAADDLVFDSLWQDDQAVSHGDNWMLRFGVDMNLKSNTQYWVTVEVTNDNGSDADSAASASVTFTTADDFTADKWSKAA